MHYILGCDIGTTAVKAIAFNANGRILASESAGYPLFHPQPGWSEQNPFQILEAVTATLRKVTALLPGKPSGISFSAAMHSLMTLNGAMQPGSPLLIWADNRSGALADTLRESEAGQRQYARTGTPIHAMTPACKLLWMKQHQPDLVANAFRFCGIKEFVIYQLTGEFVTDYSMAAAMGLLNLETLGWDVATLDSLDLPAARLPEIAPPYHYLPLAATSPLPELAGVPVILGASDGCLANLGSGALYPGSLALTIGTSGAIRKTMLRPFTDPAMRTFCYPLDQETFIVGGPTNNGGIVFQWLKDNFFPDLTHEALFQKAALIPAGSDGLLFFPYLLGERAPLWDASARGIFHGIDITHTRFHFARAVLEGILFNLAGIGKALTGTTAVHTLHANGGFAQSDLWIQMLADITGIKVALNATNDTGCIGAAIIGMRALGFLQDFAAASHFVSVAREVHPDPVQHDRYRPLLARFEALQSSLPFRSA